MKSTPNAWTGKTRKWSADEPIRATAGTRRGDKTEMKRIRQRDAEGVEDQISGALGMPEDEDGEESTKTTTIWLCSVLDLRRYPRTGHAWEKSGYSFARLTEQKKWPIEAVALKAAG